MACYYDDHLYLRVLLSLRDSSLDLRFSDPSTSFDLPAIRANALDNVRLSSDDLDRLTTMKS